MAPLLNRTGTSRRPRARWSRSPPCSSASSKASPAWRTPGPRPMPSRSRAGLAMPELAVPRDALIEAVQERRAQSRHPWDGQHLRSVQQIRSVERCSWICLLDRLGLARLISRTARLLGARSRADSGDLGAKERPGVGGSGPRAAQTASGPSGAIAIGSVAPEPTNNFEISGFILLGEGTIRPGDRIEIEGTRDIVEKIGERSTRVRRLDGLELLIPNSQSLENSVTNLTLSDPRVRITIQVGVADGSPTRGVQALLLEIARAQDQVFAEPAPVVAFEDFGDSALIFHLYVWIDLAAQDDYRVRRERAPSHHRRTLRGQGLRDGLPPDVRAPRAQGRGPCAGAPPIRADRRTDLIGLGPGPPRPPGRGITPRVPETGSALLGQATRAERGVALDHPSGDSRSRPKALSALRGAGSPRSGRCPARAASRHRLPVGPTRMAQQPERTERQRHGVLGHFRLLRFDEAVRAASAKMVPWR